MAIKERKQITGTTAQIDAYAGHEGQIVWDKEKKTLVGMSGTAGENYPLAPKTYVDNEVAKKQPKGDYATNAQLTEGLAGKEDKGTCLPLTGGELTGVLHLKNEGQLFQHKDTPNNYGYTILTSKGGGDVLNSCVLFLANPSSPDKGTMILRYVDESGVNRELYMRGTTDEFYWNKRPVETVSGLGDTYIRYSNGLQICWGCLEREATFNLVPLGELYGARVTDFITFPVPFMGNPIVTTTANNNFTPQQEVTVNSTGITNIWFAKDIQNRSSSTGYIAIGRWKEC